MAMANHSSTSLTFVCHNGKSQLQLTACTRHISMCQGSRVIISPPWLSRDTTHQLSPMLPSYMVGDLKTVGLLHCG